jgi:hypothetical protein
MTPEELEVELQARRSYLPLRIEITVDDRDRTRAPDFYVREVLHNLHYRCSSTEIPIARSSIYIATQEQPIAHLLQASRDWCHPDSRRSLSLHVLYQRMGLPRMEVQMAYDVFTTFLTIEAMRRASTEDAHNSPAAIQIEDSFPRSWCIGGYRFLEKLRLAELNSGLRNRTLGTPLISLDETDRAIEAWARRTVAQSNNNSSSLRVDDADAVTAAVVAAQAISPSVVGHNVISSATDAGLGAQLYTEHLQHILGSFQNAAFIPPSVLEHLTNLQATPSPVAPPKPALADALLQRGRRLTLPAPTPRETGA